MENDTLPSQSGFRYMALLLFIGLIMVAGAFYVGLQIGKKQSPISPPLIANIPPTLTVIPTSALSSRINWKTYVNHRVGISFDYPSDWTLKEATDEVLQVSLYPPESNPDLPSSNVHFYLDSRSYLPEPTPYQCMTDYMPYYIDSGVVGRKSEDQPSSTLCLPVTGGCFPTAEIQFPIMSKVLVVRYCLDNKIRFEEIINTLKIIQ
jgi:hypothetical protein